MKKLLIFVVCALLAACAGMTSSSRTINVSLSGSEEVPPISVPGSGRGSFTIGVWIWCVSQEINCLADHRQESSLAGKT
jgi:hypothetical protein